MEPREKRRENYRAIVEELKRDYGDFTRPENHDSLLKMLEERFKPVSRNFFSTCDMETDKIYLWIWSENWDSPNLRKIQSMKFLHCFGFLIDVDEGLEMYDEEVEIQQEVLERARQVFGNDTYPTLSDFLGSQVQCNYLGATELSQLITTATGWDIISPVECPLVAVHQFFTFYTARGWTNMLDNIQKTTVLYENYGAAAWNGWSGPLFAYELLPKRKTSSLNYPRGITLK